MNTYKRPAIEYVLTELSNLNAEVPTDAARVVLGAAQDADGAMQLLREAAEKLQKTLGRIIHEIDDKGFHASFSGLNTSQQAGDVLRLCFEFEERTRSVDAAVRLYRALDDEPKKLGGELAARSRVEEER